MNNCIARLISTRGDAVEAFCEDGVQQGGQYDTDDFAALGAQRLRAGVGALSQPLRYLFHSLPRVRPDPFGKIEDTRHRRHGNASLPGDGLDAHAGGMKGNLALALAAAAPLARTNLWRSSRVAW